MPRYLVYRRFKEGLELPDRRAAIEPRRISRIQVLDHYGYGAP